IPNSVVEMFSGALGRPEGGWPKKVERIILRGAKPRRARPAPVDLDDTAHALEKKIGHKPARADVLSYLMYPDVFVKFAKARQTYGVADVLPTPQFFYGMDQGEEIAVEIEPGKTLIVKYLTTSEPRPDGHRTVFFELNGQPREVDLRDRRLEVKKAERAQADPANAGHVGAPIPGVVASIAVELNEAVVKGAPVLVLEAMKMQSTVYAPVAGRVTGRLVAAGDSVEAKDLLLVIE
ncbi:MAG: biotin/lipoyl-containing protein, partial [Bryobacteraceae bacterium]